MISINIFSRREFIDLYKKTGNIHNQYYISILPTGGPDGDPILHPADNVITLIFDDVLKDELKSMLPIEDNMFMAKCFTVEQAKQLNKFINNIKIPCVVNIHCVEGRSRSFAIARFLLETITHGNKLVYELLKSA